MNKSTDDRLSLEDLLKEAGFTFAIVNRTLSDTVVAVMWRWD